MSIADFTAKERLRFRKLLEVAYSTHFPGERAAALSAAERLAAAHGLTLREAAGMREAPEPHEPAPGAKAAARPAAGSKSSRAGFRADFGAADPAEFGRWWMHQRANGFAAGQTPQSEAARTAAEKKRRDEAMEDALRRGLDAEERKAAAKRAAQRETIRLKRQGAWRSRPEFIRVLLSETAMSAKDIAAVVGVTVYDVFREKLLMRRARAA